MLWAWVMGLAERERCWRSCPWSRQEMPVRGTLWGSTGATSTRTVTKEAPPCGEGAALKTQIKPSQLLVLSPSLKIWICHSLSCTCLLAYTLHHLVWFEFQNWTGHLSWALSFSGMLLTTGCTHFKVPAIRKQSLPLFLLWVPLFKHVYLVRRQGPRVLLSKTATNFIPKTNKHMKRCFTSLINSKMWIKTTMKYQFAPVRTAIIQKSKDSKWWRGCGIKGTLLHCR